MKKPGVGGFFMTAILTKTEFFCRAVCTTDYTIDECMQRFFLDKLPDDFARGKRLPADARAATDACGAGAPQSTDAKCTAQANAPAAVSGRLHMRRLNERRFFLDLCFCFGTASCPHLALIAKSIAPSLEKNDE
jgi:hypothetical protein